MNTAEAIKLVDPFRSVDPARERIHTAFHAGLWGRPYICASDGHSAALVHCAEASAVTVPRPEGVEPPPPMEYVLPDDAERVGSLRVSDLEALRELPKSWTSFVDFTPNEAPRLTATRHKKRGQRELSIKIVQGAALDFKNTIEVSTAVQVAYLLRAVDFCQTEIVTVWRRGRGKKQEDEPLLFTPGYASGYKDADRLALTMPVRK